MHKYLVESCTKVLLSTVLNDDDNMSVTSDSEWLEHESTSKNKNLNNPCTSDPNPNLNPVRF